MEESIATYFSILAWSILSTEEPGRQQLTGLQKSQTQQKHLRTHVLTEILTDEENETRSFGGSV